MCYQYLTLQMNYVLWLGVLFINTFLFLYKFEKKHAADSLITYFYKKSRLRLSNTDRFPTSRWLCHLFIMQKIK